MAIPTNIHVPRFVAACFGISLPGELQPSHLQEAVVAVGTALGASPEESRSFWERAQAHIISVASSIADGQKSISQDRLIHEQLALLEEWLKSLGKTRAMAIGAVFQQWLESRLVIPFDDFQKLFLFFAAFWSAAKTADESSRLCISTARTLGQVLISEQPANFEKALKVWRPVPEFQTEKLNKAFMQTQSRIMRNAARGLTATSEDIEAQRDAIDYMIRAWHEAYETTIYNVCLLFWLVKRKPGKAIDPAEAPTQKGVLYDNVVNLLNPKRTSADQSAASSASSPSMFPFYEHLPRVRNPSAHASCLIDDELRIVTFIDKAAQKEHEMSFDNIRENALRDIIMANMFPVGLTLALRDRENVAGKFDAEWARLAAKVDIDSLIDTSLDQGNAPAEPAPE